MMTRVIICRKSDRELRTLYVDEPVYKVRDKYIKAALGDRQLDMGQWSIDLNENLVLSIEQTVVKRARYPLGLMKFVKPAIDGKWPSSAEY